MKWFQVDSDTPNDPKIAAIIRQMGAEGFGALVLLWCHIADHGTRKPGWSIDTKGKPMPETELLEASHLCADQFSQLVTLCVASRHFLKKPWETKRVIAIPAMIRRADTYTKRRVRTPFAQSAKNVGESSSTRQDIPSTTNTPLTPLTGGRVTRAEKQHAKEVLSKRFGHCQHDPACANTEQCLLAIIAERRVKRGAA